MRPIRIVAVGLFFATVMAITPSHLSGQEPQHDGLNSEAEKQIQAILSSKYPYKSQLGPGAAEGYVTLFSIVGAKGLPKLTSHSNDGVALQAAWEEVAITVPEKEGTGVYRPDRHKLDWFLGFLEGRLRVQAPRWWADCLLDARANHRTNIYPGSPNARPYDSPTMEREEHKILFHIGKETVSLDRESFPRAHSIDEVVALADQKRCYVAVHDNVGSPFPVACFDRATGKKNWEAKAWGTWWGDSTGQHHMWVSMVQDEKRLIVFGRAETGLHIDGFNIEDGSNTFRFATSLWGGH
jgi:hypothetical protein